MKVEALTNAVPNQLDEHEVEILTTPYLPSGVATRHPVLLDVRDEGGQLLYRMHLRQEEVERLSRVLSGS